MLILVVDDEAEIREALTLYLESAGFSVEQVENGQLALDRLNSAKTPPNCVLADIRMPVLDGVAMLKQIKASSRKNVPVVMMTGYSDHSEAEILAAGAFGLLNKPFDLTEMMEMLVRALDSARSMP